LQLYVDDMMFMI